MPGKVGGALPAPVWERFWAKVTRQGPDECWLWEGAHNDSGYGVIWDGRRNVYAHRLSWVLHGGTIADGLTVDHLCFNRLCVNPKHLEPVPHLVNVRRAVAHRPRPAPPSATGIKRSAETRARMSEAQRRRRGREKAADHQLDVVWLCPRHHVRAHRGIAA